MKKYILALIFIVVLGSATGCARSNNTNAEKTLVTKQTNSQTKATTNTPNTKVTKDNVKNLSDDELLKMAEEPPSTIDNLDLEDDDLSALDSIINNQDLTSDIPASVVLKK